MPRIYLVAVARSYASRTDVLILAPADADNPTAQRCRGRSLGVTQYSGPATLAAAIVCPEWSKTCAATTFSSAGASTVIALRQRMAPSTDCGPQLRLSSNPSPLQAGLTVHWDMTLIVQPGCTDRGIIPSWAQHVKQTETSQLLRRWDRALEEVNEPSANCSSMRRGGKASEITLTEASVPGKMSDQTSNSRTDM